MLVTIFISIRRLALSNQVRIIRHAESILVNNHMQQYDLIYFAGPIQVEEEKLIVLQNFMTEKGSGRNFKFDSFEKCVEKLKNYLSEEECKKIMDSPIIPVSQQGREKRRQLKKVMQLEEIVDTPRLRERVHPVSYLETASDFDENETLTQQVNDTKEHIDYQQIDELERRRHSAIEFLENCYEKHYRPKHLWFTSVMDNDIFNTFCILSLKHNRNIIRLAKIDAVSTSNEIVSITFVTSLTFEDISQWIKQIAIHKEPAVVNNNNYTIVPPNFETLLKQKFMLLEEIIDAFVSQMARKIRHQWIQPRPILGNSSRPILGNSSRPILGNSFEGPTFKEPPRQNSTIQFEDLTSIEEFHNRPTSSFVKTPAGSLKLQIFKQNITKSTDPLA